MIDHHLLNHYLAAQEDAHMDALRRIGMSEAEVLRRVSLRTRSLIADALSNQPLPDAD